MEGPKYKVGQAVQFTKSSGNAPGQGKTIEEVQVHNGIYFYCLLGMTGLWVASSLEPWTGEPSGEPALRDI